MDLILNIIVLIFEVLYYSLFMKFARKEGKFWRYLLLFTLISIFFFFVGTNQVYSHLLLVVLIVYGLKLIVKLKISLYDMLLVFLMLISKLIIEMPFSLIIYKFINNIYIASINAGIIKILFLCIFNKVISNIYNYCYKMWINNNFYIRYIFTIFMFIYIIVTCVFFVIQWL